MPFRFVSQTPEKGSALSTMDDTTTVYTFHDDVGRKCTQHDVRARARMPVELLRMLAPETRYCVSAVRVLVRVRWRESRSIIYATVLHTGTHMRTHTAPAHNGALVWGANALTETFRWSPALTFMIIPHIRHTNKHIQHMCVLVRCVRAVCVCLYMNMCVYICLCSYVPG